ncbi:hypothetical protein GJAV_G00193130 [Gymnothorax javanicus]|nr:hypothetical protein GJAV_G00193130 [Gymnothorax javanicus]
MTELKVTLYFEMNMLMCTRENTEWSFGILLYELITFGAPSYPELEPLDIFPQIQNSYRMKKPENCGGPL